MLRKGFSRTVIVKTGFPHGSDGKEPACKAGDPGLIPGLGRSPGGGNGYPLQYSYLENSMDRGAWQVTIHGSHKELDTTKRLILSFSQLILSLSVFIAIMQR